MSLEEILCQAVAQLGYYSTESGPAYTREGLYQNSYEFRTTPDPTAEPMFTVYDKALFLVDVKQMTAHLFMH